MYDQQGIWIQRQWNVFEAFISKTKGDYLARQTHLEVERIRLRRYVQKLQMVDDLFDGTSLRGNPGASQKAGTPTQCGGDLTWSDDLEQVNLLTKASPVGWDADIASIVNSIKSRSLPMIKRRHEETEFKLKKALDRIDQLRSEIKQLDEFCKKDGKIDKWLDYVKAEFSAKQKSTTSIPLSGSLIGANDLKGEKKVPEIRNRKNLFADNEVIETRDWPRVSNEILEELISSIDTQFNGQTKTNTTVNPEDGFSKVKPE